MAAPTVDPGIASLANNYPCMIRHWLGQTGNAALFVNYDFFPWKGQNIDTPGGKVAPVWTSDDDTHPLP
jgi:hypothetical protein